MHMSMTPLTHCKNAKCREPISVKDVFEERDIKESPQHILVIFKCSQCMKVDRMVGTVHSWNAFKDEEQGERVDASQETDKTLQAAAIEVGVIEGVDDLITLWRSYQQPPMREAVMGSCQCDECKERREYGTR